MLLQCEHWFLGNPVVFFFSLHASRRRAIASLMTYTGDMHDRACCNTVHGAATTFLLTVDWNPAARDHKARLALSR